MSAKSGIIKVTENDFNNAIDELVKYLHYEELDLILGENKGVKKIEDTIQEKLLKKLNEMLQEEYFSHVNVRYFEEVGEKVKSEVILGVFAEIIGEKIETDLEQINQIYNNYKKKLWIFEKMKSEKILLKVMNIAIRKKDFDLAAVLLKRKDLSKETRKELEAKAEEGARTEKFFIEDGMLIDLFGEDIPKKIRETAQDRFLNLGPDDRSINSATIIEIDRKDMEKFLELHTKYLCESEEFETFTGKMLEKIIVSEIRGDIVDTLCPFLFHDSVPERIIGIVEKAVGEGLEKGKENEYSDFTLEKLMELAVKTKSEKIKSIAEEIISVKIEEGINSERYEVQNLFKSGIPEKAIVRAIEIWESKDDYEKLIEILDHYIIPLPDELTRGGSANFGGGIPENAGNNVPKRIKDALYNAFIQVINRLETEEKFEEITEIIAPKEEYSEMAALGKSKKYRRNLFPEVITIGMQALGKEGSSLMTALEYSRQMIENDLSDKQWHGSKKLVPPKGPGKNGMKNIA
ncbi:MAG: hypothetical protein WC501_03560 [Candidatus Micrarchaeia archaeon]